MTEILSEIVDNNSDSSVYTKVVNAIKPKKEAKSSITFKAIEKEIFVKPNKKIKWKQKTFFE